MLLTNTCIIEMLKFVFVCCGHTLATCMYLLCIYDMIGSPLPLSFPIYNAWLTLAACVQCWILPVYVTGFVKSSCWDIAQNSQGFGFEHFHFPHSISPPFPFLSLFLYQIMWSGTLDETLGWQGYKLGTSSEHCISSYHFIAQWMYLTVTWCS